jgi:hypothetical protein
MHNISTVCICSIFVLFTVWLQIVFTPRLWIDGSDPETEHDYRHWDGVKMTYFTWLPGDGHGPDNPHRSKFGIVVKLESGRYSWDDLEDWRKFPSICEINDYYR